MIAAAVVALLASLDQDAGAQRTRDPSLLVQQLQPIVQDGEDFALEVRVRNHTRLDRDDLRVLVTVHPPISWRVQLHQALSEGPTGEVVHALTADVPEVPARGARTLRLSQERAELGLGAAADGAAVHPVRIALQRDGEAVDEVTTALVVDNGGNTPPLQVAMLLPVAAPPLQRPSGDIDAAALETLLGADANLPGLLDSLRHRPDLPVTLASDGLALLALDRVRGGVTVADGDTRREIDPESPTAARANDVLESLAAVVNHDSVEQLALPYGGTDLSALVRHGADEEALRHVGDATGDVERLTGARPRAQTLWPAAPIDASTVGALRAGISTVITQERYLDIDEDRQLTPEASRQLRAGQAGLVHALVPDPWIEQALEEATDARAPLAAARVIAEIATAQLERPGLEGRGLLVAPPSRHTPSGRSVGLLLDAIEMAGFAELTGLDALEDITAERDLAAADLDYPSSVRGEELPAGYIRALRRARARIGSLTSMLTEDEELVATLDRQLLQAASAHFRGDLADGRELIDGVAQSATQIHDSVSVPEMAPVTLTAEESNLPVSITSRADVPLRVHITLQTPAFEVDDGPTREVDLQPNSTEVISFRVRAITPGGTSPVQVVVTDPDGVHELAVGAIVVRSTAFSLAGIIVTAAAALFLIAALWKEITRRRERTADIRRRRRPAKEPAAR